MTRPTLASWLLQEPFTLALSSSFFGFFAHCGVAAALYERGCFPRKITGASAGALVAGALGSGLSPMDARDLFFGIKKSDFWDPAPGFGLLRGRKFLQLLERHLAPTFERATVPIEAAVLDIFSCKTRFLTEGPLPNAVLASCAVPFMFHPVKIGKKVFLDGGVFHKSGINLADPDERLLCVFIQNQGIADSYEWGRSLGNIRGPQKVLRLNNLPRVNYNSLETGKAAYAEAYQRCLTALELPLPV